MGDIKNYLNQKVDLYIGSRLVSVGPRSTFKASDRDIQASSQLQELLTRKSFRKLESSSGKSSGKATRKASGKGKATDAAE